MEITLVDLLLIIAFVKCLISKDYFTAGCIVFAIIFPIIAHIMRYIRNGRHCRSLGQIDWEDA